MRVKDSDKVKILWLNQSGVHDFDQPVADYLRNIKNDNTKVEVISFDKWPDLGSLEYRSYEALILGDTVSIARYASLNDFDAMIVGCFYDPGLDASLEISGKTLVVGPCKASVQMVSNLCRKFSVIIGRDKWQSQMTENIEGYGYSGKLASMRSVDIASHDIKNDCNFTIDRIVDAGRLAIQEDKAEAIVLGCTLNLGMFKEVQRELEVPVIDPVVAAFKMGEFMGRLRKQFDWYPSRVGGCEPPSDEQLNAFSLFKSSYRVTRSW